MFLGIGYFAPDYINVSNFRAVKRAAYLSAFLFDNKIYRLLPFTLVFRIILLRIAIMPPIFIPAVCACTFPAFIALYLIVQFGNVRA